MIRFGRDLLWRDELDSSTTTAAEMSHVVGFLAGFGDDSAVCLHVFTVVSLPEILEIHA